MFHRAVVEHSQTVTAPKSSRVAQHFHSSNGSTSRNTASVTSLRSSQASSQGSTGKLTAYSGASALKPSTEAMLNGAVGVPRNRTGSADVARGSSRSSALLSTLSQRGDPFCDNITSTLAGTPPNKPNGVRMFDYEVLIDENDFDDDADLDLDVEDPGLKSFVTQPPQASPLDQAPVSRNVVVTENLSRPVSSAPLSWSSSPTEPRTASARPSLPIIQPPHGVQGDATMDNDVNPRPKKRRHLPWNQSSSNPSEGKVASSRASGRAKGDTNALSPTDTPDAVKTSNSQYPWDKTASAMKEEQRQLRRTGKKAQTSAEAKKERAGETVLPRSHKSVGQVFLSDEQKRVAKLVIEQGKSVFFTGSAGTGKSVLLREIIRSLQAKYSREPDRVAVTASTGLAACNVGGVTLHSFSGIGLGKEDAKELIKRVKKNSKARTRWMRTKVLIIDEISMVDGDLFDKLEEIARNVRNSGRAFGGIQLIITGDFFQLPPVPDQGKLARFAFEAATWSTSIAHTIGLSQVFRQKDPVFAGMLNEMRLGNLTKASIDTFRNLCRPIHYNDDLDATELFPTRSEVDNANNTRMKYLDGDGMLFTAIDGGSIKDEVQRGKLLSNCMAPPTLALKKGAQVMLIKNLDDSLVNGSLGKVLGFMDEREFEIFSRTDNDFEVYQVHGPDPEEMSKFRKKFKNKMDPDMSESVDKRWPYVRFSNADGTSRHLLVQPEMWKIELPNGEVQASRSQVPLILAWALSIHKAQGQTLERVKVDLGRVFEKGQAYVALSRATCQEGLQVLRFDPKKVMAHDKVRNFYNSLYRAGGIAVPTSNNNGTSKIHYKDGVQWDGGAQGMDEDEEEAFRQAEAYG